MADKKPTQLKWNPWQVYDVSEREMRAVKERAKFRAAMKKEYQMKATNPYQRTGGAPVFDPAIQRYMAMKATALEHFKPNPKTFMIGMMGYVLPVVTLCFLTSHFHNLHEKKLRNGEVAYRDRTYKFVQ